MTGTTVPAIIFDFLAVLTQDAHLHRRTTEFRVTERQYETLRGMLPSMGCPAIGRDTHATVLGRPVRVVDNPSEATVWNLSASCEAVEA